MAALIPISADTGDIVEWLDPNGAKVTRVWGWPIDPGMVPGGTTPAPGGAPDPFPFRAQLLRCRDGRFCYCAWEGEPRRSPYSGCILTATGAAELLLAEGVQPPEVVAQAAMREMRAAGSADPRLPPAAHPSLRLLPLPGRRLIFIHYSCGLIQDCKAHTPEVSAIAVRVSHPEDIKTFAAFYIAEQRDLVAEFLLRLEELEREVLRSFYQFVAANPDPIWVHWGMKKPDFGFDVLAQRARRHRLKPVEIPHDRRFDLRGYLRQRYGMGFAEHPQFWGAVRANAVGAPGMLDDSQSAAAWANGEYAALVRSLVLKTGAIKELLDLVRANRFRTSGAGEAGNSGLAAVAGAEGATPVTVPGGCRTASAGDEGQDSPPRRERRRPVRDEKLEARDKWIYDRCCAKTPYKQIISRLRSLRPKRGWRVISTVPGIRRAAAEYAKRHHLPDPPMRHNS